MRTCEETSQDEWGKEVRSLCCLSTFVEKTIKAKQNGSDWKTKGKETKDIKRKDEDKTFESENKWDLVKENEKIEEALEPRNAFLAAVYENARLQMDGERRKYSS